MRKMTRATGLAAAALTVVAVAACGSSSSSSSPASTSTPAAGSTATASPAASSAGTTLKATTIGGTQVLTNSAGMTLYWFAPDTSTKSNCTGSCATYWPPVIGKPAAAAGMSLPKGLGTITRSNGQKQATYDGHPLYTYAADTAPGQIKGNGLNVSGGLWWAMTPSGAKLGAAAKASTSSSGGYGY